MVQETLIFYSNIPNIYIKGITSLCAHENERSYTKQRRRTLHHLKSTETKSREKLPARNGDLVGRRQISLSGKAIKFNP